MTDIEKLFNEREEIFSKALSNEKGSRIPIITNDTTWKYFYAGHEPREGWYDTEVNKAVFRKYYGDIYLDGVRGSHYCRMVKDNTLKMVGGGTYEYVKGGLQQTKPGATTVMEADEYDELIKDPYKFILEKVFPRRYELMHRNDDKKYDDFCRVMDDCNAAVKNMIEEAKIPFENFGLCQLTSGGYFNPVDHILDFLRDFDVLMRDIKKQPDKVRDAGLALVDLSVDYVGNAPQGPTFSCSVPMHLPPFINRKDFEKVYWPSWKKTAEIISAKGYKSCCIFESSFAHVFDFVAELPKGIVATLEKDTPWDFKKALPNIPVIGGMPNELLAFGTKEKCIDYVKMLLDKMAPYGGYIFCPNMGLMVLSDCKAENLIAVNEYVRDHGKY